MDVDDGDLCCAKTVGRGRREGEREGTREGRKDGEVEKEKS
jgi:hypothetical protein